MPNNRLRHRLKLPTGAFVVGTWRHRVMAKPGAIVRYLGTGWCHQPVPNVRTMAPGLAMTRCCQVPMTKAPVGNFNRCRCLVFDTGCSALSSPPPPLRAGAPPSPLRRPVPCADQGPRRKQWRHRAPALFLFFP